MPEGDSLRRLATRLAPLVGATLERVTTQGLPRALAGRTVTAVDAHGKHLLIDLDDGTQIRTHLGMNGRVRDYKLAQLYAAAHELMTASVRGGRAAYRVYLQHQCMVCGATIERAQLGVPPRWTWWCPRCQPAAPGC